MKKESINSVATLVLLTAVVVFIAAHVFQIGVLNAVSISIYILGMLTLLRVQFCVGRSLTVLGALSNLTAIVSNHCTMPVYDNLDKIGVDYVHSIATASTRFPLLCDRFSLFGGNAIASIGDFTIVAGVIIILLQKFLRKA